MVQFSIAKDGKEIRRGWCYPEDVDSQALPGETVTILTKKDSNSGS